MQSLLDCSLPSDIWLLVRGRLAICNSDVGAEDHGHLRVFVFLENKTGAIPKRSELKGLVMGKLAYI